MGSKIIVPSADFSAIALDTGRITPTLLPLKTMSVVDVIYGSSNFGVFSDNNRTRIRSTRAIYVADGDVLSLSGLQDADGLNGLAVDGVFYRSENVGVIGEATHTLNGDHPSTASDHFYNLNTNGQDTLSISMPHTGWLILGFRNATDGYAAISATSYTIKYGVNL